MVYLSTQFKEMGNIFVKDILIQDTYNILLRF